MMRRLARKLGVRGGQTTAEYAIIVALIAVCSIGVILIFGDQIRALFAGEAKKLTNSDQPVQVENKTGNVDQTVHGGLDKF